MKKTIFAIMWMILFSGCSSHQQIVREPNNTWSDRVGGLEFRRGTPSLVFKNEINFRASFVHPTYVVLDGNQTALLRASTYRYDSNLNAEELFIDSSTKRLKARIKINESAIDTQIRNVKEIVFLVDYTYQNQSCSVKFGDVTWGDKVSHRCDVSNANELILQHFVDGGALTPDLMNYCGIPQTAELRRVPFEAPVTGKMYDNTNGIIPFDTRHPYHQFQFHVLKTYADGTKSKMLTVSCDLPTEVYSQGSVAWQRAMNSVGVELKDYEVRPFSPTSGSQISLPIQIKQNIPAARQRVRSIEI